MPPTPMKPSTIFSFGGDAGRLRLGRGLGRSVASRGSCFGGILGGGRQRRGGQELATSPVFHGGQWVPVGSVKPTGCRSLPSDGLHSTPTDRHSHFEARGMPKSPSMFRQTEWMWLAPFWVLLNSMRKVGPWTR